MCLFVGFCVFNSNGSTASIRLRSHIKSLSPVNLIKHGISSIISILGLSLVESLSRLFLLLTWMLCHSQMFWMLCHLLMFLVV